MEEEKFTKGNWSVTDSKVVMSESGKVAYAYSGGDIPYLKGTDANANLIAAAPDMYWALKEIAENLLEHDNRLDIEKILAKARGET